MKRLPKHDRRKKFTKTDLEGLHEYRHIDMVGQFALQIWN